MTAKRPLAAFSHLISVIQLINEVKRHGPDLVFDNRVNRAELFRDLGHGDEADRLEKEAEQVLVMV